jgi:hypothetical protein
MKFHYGGFVVYKMVKRPRLRTMIVKGYCRIGMSAGCGKLATTSFRKTSSGQPSFLKQRGCGETA